jgi:hypothetical protein
MPGSGSSLLSTNRLARSDIFPQLSVAHNERRADHYIPKARIVKKRELFEFNKDAGFIGRSGLAGSFGEDC